MLTTQQAMTITDTDRLVAMIGEENEWPIRVAAARNPNLPGAWLESLTVEPSAIKYHAARNVSCPSARLAELARSTDPVMRRAVATNPSTPIGAVRALANDSDDAVKRAAHSMLRTPLGKWTEREDRTPRSREAVRVGSAKVTGLSHTERVQAAARAFSEAVDG